MNSLEDFGKRVRERRTAKGWSQEALAAEALGNSDRKGYISQIENGRLRNITVETVQKIARALEIPPGEIGQLHGMAETAGTDMPPLLLENLAMRFGHANPDAGAEALSEFLKEKAKDYRAMEARLKLLEATEGRIANIVAAARGAIDAGDFAEADAWLADAEEMQQAEHTLVQVEKQAAIRMQRFEAALLAQDPDAAAEHVWKAAGFFAPFDRLEEAAIAHIGAKPLYRHGRRYGGTGLGHAARLWRFTASEFDELGDFDCRADALNNLGMTLRLMGSRTVGRRGEAFLTEAIVSYQAALKIWNREANPDGWARTKTNLAITLREQATRIAGEEGTAKLLGAIAAYREVLEFRKHSGAFPAWARVQHNLGIALRQLGRLSGGIEGTQYFGEAAAAFRAALNVRTREIHAENWARTQSVLGNVLRAQARMTVGNAGAVLLREALVAHRAALEVRTRVDHPVDWSETMNNLGNVLRDIGVRRNSPSLLTCSVAAYNEALEVRAREEHPRAWAQTQNNLGLALLELGLRTEGDVGMNLLRSAQSACSSASEVRTLEDHPVDWAETMEGLAKIDLRLSFLDDLSAAVPHAGAALEKIEQALTVFSSRHTPGLPEGAIKLRDEIVARLEILSRL